MTNPPRYAARLAHNGIIRDTGPGLLIADVADGTRGEAQTRSAVDWNPAVIGHERALLCAGQGR